MRRPGKVRPQPTRSRLHARHPIGIKKNKLAKSDVNACISTQSQKETWSVSINKMNWIQDNRPPHGELYEQRQIERGLALCMQGGYLAVHLPYGLFPRVDEPPQTGLQSGYVGQQAQGFHGQSVFISFLEKVNARTAESGTDDHEHRHSGRHLPAIEPQVKEDGESPETEWEKMCIMA